MCLCLWVGVEGVCVGLFLCVGVIIVSLADRCLCVYVLGW